MFKLPWLITSQPLIQMTWNLAGKYNTLLYRPYGNLERARRPENKKIEHDFQWSKASYTDPHIHRGHDNHWPNQTGWSKSSLYPRMKDALAAKNLTTVITTLTSDIIFEWLKLRDILFSQHHILNCIMQVSISSREWGFWLPVLSQGEGFCAEWLSRGEGFCSLQVVFRGFVRGGMAMDEIDTCITTILVTLHINQKQ